MGSWWRLEKKHSKDKDARTRCMAKFQLADPVKSNKWVAYLVQRKVATIHFSGDLSYNKLEVDFMLKDLALMLQSTIRTSMLARRISCTIASFQLA